MSRDENPTPCAPDFGCACAAVRHAARLVTRLYEEELREHLAIPQFAMLSVIEKRPGASQAALAEALDLDKTTLSRNLKLLEKNGWILRDRGCHITASGQKVLRAARPGWKRAQTRLQSAMTGNQWQDMWRTFGNISAAAGKTK